jgi:hypothetical protein
VLYYTCEERPILDATIKRINKKFQQLFSLDIYLLVKYAVINSVVLTNLILEFIVHCWRL